MAPASAPAIIAIPGPTQETSVRFEGTVEIGAPRERVWAFLMDPNQVGPCGPGVESVEVVDDTHFRAKAKVGIGFISARFSVAMEIAERDEPNRAVIKARGQAPGSVVDASATMALRDGKGGGTVMDWDADVLIGGTIASVGARLIEGTANKMIAQTFDCIRAKLEA
jgi:carbon monoxide dehydrogenase subunit G